MKYKALKMQDIRNTPNPSKSALWLLYFIITKLKHCGGKNITASKNKF